MLYQLYNSQTLLNFRRRGYRYENGFFILHTLQSKRGRRFRAAPHTLLLLFCKSVYIYSVNKIGLSLLLQVRNKHILKRTGRLLSSDNEYLALPCNGRFGLLTFGAQSINSLQEEISLLLNKNEHEKKTNLFIFPLA